MRSEKYTLLELTDLALNVPMLGGVNFNILHTVLSTVIEHTGLAEMKPPCHIVDENMAQMSITRRRMESRGKGAKKPPKTATASEVNQRINNVQGEPRSDDAQPAVKTQEGTVESPQGPAAAEETEIVEAESHKMRESEDEDSKEEENTEQIAKELPLETEEEKDSDENAPLQGELVREIGEDVLQEAAIEILEQKADALVEEVAQRIVGKGEYLLEAEPSKLVSEMWRATNINRRMDAAEDGLVALSRWLDEFRNKVKDMEEKNSRLWSMVGKLDEIAKHGDRIKALEESCKTLSLEIEDCNEQRALEVERLEDINKNLEKNTQSALSELSSNLDDLSERVAYKHELEELTERMSEALDSRMRDVKRLMREMEETLVKREDFGELVARVDELELLKVNREELGRLLEPGFIDSFLEEQVNLRSELEELKVKVGELEVKLEALETKINVEVIEMMETRFSEVNSELDTVKAKLALLDPDEINDSFANLEEQTEMILKELAEMKLAAEQFQKEARINFNKILNVNELLNRLEQTKADKSKMYELLEMKADVDMLTNKLDRSEFVAVVGDMNEKLERFSIKVNINEEEMNSNFAKVREDLSFKMYTEDFISGTKPIRNRIKALMYELEQVKKIALERLFPDASGVVKCLSCNREAHLAGQCMACNRETQLTGPKCMGDAQVDHLQEIRPSRRKVAVDDTSMKRSKEDPDSQGSAGAGLPLDDIDCVPIPPPDYPREKDPQLIQHMIATAKPDVGLKFEMRHREIDKKLEEFFATRSCRPVDGKHTRTLPQQRGRLDKDKETVDRSQSKKTSSECSVSPKVVCLRVEKDPNDPWGKKAPFPSLKKSFSLCTQPADNQAAGSSEASK